MSPRTAASANCPRTTCSMFVLAWTSATYPWKSFGRNLTNDEGKTSDTVGNTPNGAMSTGVIRPLSFGLTVTAEF